MLIPGLGFGIDAGLLFTQNRANLNLGEKEICASQGYSTKRSNLYYLEIPIHLNFKFTNMGGIENTIAPLAFVGPSFSFLVGHNKIDALKYATGELGIEFGLGCELFKKVQIRGSYCMGFTYALKTELLKDYSAQNRTWKASVIYLF